MENLDAGSTPPGQVTSLPRASVLPSVQLVYWARLAFYKDCLVEPRVCRGASAPHSGTLFSIVYAELPPKTVRIQHLQLS